MTNITRKSIFAAKRVARLSNTTMGCAEFQSLVKLFQENGGVPHDLPSEIAKQRDYITQLRESAS